MTERSTRSSTSEADRYARSLIEVSRNPLVSIDPQGKIADINAATVEAVGIPRDQLIGSDFADCFSEPEKARAAYELVLEEGLLSDHRLTLRHVSGALTEVEYNAAVYRDAGGELRAVFAAARDPAEAQEARRQVARLALVAASSHDAIFSRDLEGVITSWNAAAEMVYGYAAEEAIGRDGTLLLTSAHEGETKALIKRLLIGDRGFGFETQHLRKDGSQVDVVLSLSPARDAEGEITGITIISHNVSEQVRAQRELRESEEKFAAAFRASPDLMMITRLRDGLLLEINESFTRLLGYERPETVGRTTSQLAIWADPQARNVFVASLETSGETGETETAMRRKDGTLITGVHAARSMEIQGEAVVLSVVHDITERKQAEEELRESENKYRRLFEGMAQGVVLQSSGGEIASANRAAERILGLSLDQMQGRTSVDARWRAIHEDGSDFPGEEHPSMVALRTGQAVRDVVMGVWDAGRDSYRWIEINAVPHVRPDGGEPYDVFTTFDDITERKQAEEEVRLHAEQLRRTVEGAVLAMSHMVESRDPYTAGHERRVGELATAIGAEMGLAGEELDFLRLAGTIHDIGKIGVPAEILSKPGRLSEVEFSLIKAHPQTGFDILADVDFGSPVAEMVRQHHERLDGSGYPRRLKGEEILPEARILAVADVVEAMSSHRPYRVALPLEDALAEIETGAGIRFDAGVCEAALRLFREQGFAFREERPAV